MKGTYVLLICLSECESIKIGSLGAIKFEKGWYAYVGSALKSLENRIERHICSEKSIYWHIDYLLSRAELENIFYGEGEERRECGIAEEISRDFPFIEGFGSSDCQCESHLFYSRDVSKLRDSIVLGFIRNGLKPISWYDGKEMAAEEEK